MIKDMVIISIRTRMQSLVNYEALSKIKSENRQNWQKDGDKNQAIEWYQ